MNFRRRLTVVSVIATIAACSRAPEPREPVVLADYNFLQPVEDELFGNEYGATRGLHWFESGWSTPTSGGLWSIRDETNAMFTLAGQSAQLEMVCNTSRKLAAQGQTFEVQLNGRSLSTFDMTEAWQIDTLRVDLPDDAWKPGLNRITFKPSHWMPSKNPQRGAPELAVNFRTLRITSQLTSVERDEWTALTATPPARQEDELLHLPEGDLPAALVAQQEGRVLPDVVVFLMDTVRADHVGCYGYRRDTTPTIDRLAANGVKLDNVIAEAPYTLCSVPSFFTGQSWRNHQVQHNGDALADEFITLAEIFQIAGYETFGISDNPNVSHGTNTSQGFDEFEEMWKYHNEWREVDQRGWDPERPERRFRERLDEGMPESPVFFYVHIMPPHAPYFPGPQHDLWKPNARSKITGSVAQMQQFDKGAIKAEGAPLRRLVSLYDGAMHRSDAAIGRMIDAWDGQERQRPTLYLYVSDHGEAFGEHGRFSHNSTPYDEMVHVPVVFSPANLVPGLEKSATSLRTLSDIHPILLHYLDIRPPGGTAWPRRYLDVLADPAAARERIFIRCREPVFATRTVDRLTLLQSWGEQEFYRLDKDPQAQDNQRAAGHDDYLAELRELRAWLENPAAGPDAKAAELTPEDIARLKALGYF